MKRVSEQPRSVLAQGLGPIPYRTAEGRAILVLEEKVHPEVFTRIISSSCLGHRALPLSLPLLDLLAL